MGNGLETSVVQLPKIAPKVVTTKEGKTYNVSQDANLRKIEHDGARTTDTRTKVTHFKEEGKEAKMIMTRSADNYFMGELQSREYQTLNELTGRVVAQYFDYNLGVREKEVLDAKTFKRISYESASLPPKNDK